MTILDSTLLFSDDQAIDDDAVSTNLIDKGAPGTPVGGKAALDSDWGKGKPVPIEIMVTTTFIDDTSGVSVVVNLQNDDDVAFGSPTVIWTSGLVLLAALVKGFRFPMGVLPESANERYLRLQYVMDGTMQNGTITAGIAGGLQTNRPV